MQIQNNTLYYIYDPMCSWCYAYEQSLTELQQQLPALLNFEFILGGLAADTSEPMPAATQKMVQQAWQQIEFTVPHIKFNFDFWSNNTPLRSTYPACRALIAAAQQAPEFVQLLRQQIQQAYYQAAQNPSLNTTLITCAEQTALDIKQFKADLSTPNTQIQLSEHIQFARSLGVSSYPSLRLVLDGEIYTIAINYTQSNPTLTQINTLLEQHKNRGIESPCVRNCCLNNDDICLGCFRSLDEITGWSQASELEKQAILDKATVRKMAQLV
ncbi:MAG: putative protein-disulfide isomerase [Methyloprofundus sp.]|nr:MAG: putative protein-disulfide isomerase [Methyloprofundus sp.]